MIALTGPGHVRKELLSAAAVVLLLVFFAGAQPRACEWTLARLKYGGGGDWYANPSSLPNLVAALRTETAVAVCDTVATVEIGSERLFHYPFLYMTGHGNVEFSPSERLRLRTFLTGGGFLWADDNYGMDASLRRELAALFPQNPLVPVPVTHPIYHCRHRLPGLPKIHEHDNEPAQGLGIFLDGQLVLFYSYSSDIGDGMENLDVHNDGPHKHRLALQMGVNIVCWFFAP